MCLRRLPNNRLRVAALVPRPPAKQTIFVIPKIVPGIYGALNFGGRVTDFVALNRRGRPLPVQRQDTH